MKNYRNTFYTAIIFTFIGFACTEESAISEGPDTHKPIITVLESTPVAQDQRICKSMESNVISATTGSDIILNLEFSDDSNLSQYKIDIHNNFDCHAHGRVAASSWQLLKIENISGKTVNVEEVIRVPEDVLAGDYHLQILCLDALGNEAEPVIYSVKVENAIDNIPPVLSLSEPSSGSVSIAKGADLNFKGTVTDNHSLANGKIEITYTDPGGTEFFPIQEFFPEIQGTEAAIDLTFVVPAAAASGKHEFVIKAYDTYNNAVEKLIEVDFQ